MKKFLQKKLPMSIHISGPNLMTKWFTIQNIYSKMHFTSSHNDYYDIITYEVDGMAGNVKNWVSHE